MTSYRGEANFPFKSVISIYAGLLSSIHFETFLRDPATTLPLGVPTKLKKQLKRGGNRVRLLRRVIDIGSVHEGYYLKGARFDCLS